MIEGVKTAGIILSTAALVVGTSTILGTYQIESFNARQWLSVPQAWNNRTFDSYTSGALLDTAELLFAGLVVGALAYSLSEISERRASRKPSGTSLHGGGII